jgi:hypothetical protein
MVARATPQRCFDVATDYAAFPEWSSNVLEANVLETDAEGRGAVVEYITDARVRRIRYVLRYRYDPPGAIAWDYVEGDARSVTGSYSFEPAADGTTITYRLDIDPGRFVPGPVRKILVDSVMKGSVADLVKRVEQE